MAELSPLPPRPENPHGPTTSADALSALRAATAAQHARLDSQLPIAREGASLADYAQHIAIIDRWLADIDAMAAGAWPPGWADAQQARRARIAADLAELPGAQAIHAGRSPSPSALPSGFAWGVAYVVEGSQLGGQMLYRRLREHLAPHPLHYLRGDSAGSHWPRFTAALRAALVEPGAVQAACDGADWAFASLIARFESAGAVA